MSIVYEDVLGIWHRSRYVLFIIPSHVNLSFYLRIIGFSFALLPHSAPLTLWNKHSVAVTDELFEVDQIVQTRS